MKTDFAQSIEDLNVTEALRKCVACAVVIFEREKIFLLTPDAELLLGVKSAEVLGEPLDVLPEPLRKLFQQTFVTGQPVAQQIALSKPQGESNLQVNISPIQGKRGKISGAAAVLHDFSCAEQLEKKISQIERLASIGTLSASMAHEIKNALVAIRTFTDLLLSRNPEDELAGIVGREMIRIDSIVSQMLTFSGPAKPTLTPLHLHEVLNHSLRLVQHQLDEKSVKLDRSFAATCDLVKADDYQLKQAFLNLFFNALESMPANGSLIIATDVINAEPDLPDALREKSPGRLRVMIRDNGGGIAPENLARVFEPFFTTKPKGTGLGLPITRRIINEHRGTISVESQLQQGSTFNIVFPIFSKSL
jgi:signal transduction histidine kinase